MKATAQVRIACRSPDEARALAAALAPDNSLFAACAVAGTVVVVQAGPASAGSLLRTLDDLLECARAARLDDSA